MKLSWDQVVDELAAYNLHLEMRGLGVRGLHDRTYQAIPDAWFLDEFLPWWTNYRFEAGLKPKEDGGDCDDYAYIFVAKIKESIMRRMGAAGGALASRAGVYNQTPWGGITERGPHMIAVVRTDATWRATEPQTSQQCSLATYPNLRNLQTDTLDF